MANPGPNDPTTPTGTSKPNSQPILVVILVVVLSILVLCLTGISLVIYYRRRMRGKKYTRLHPSAESSDITAIDNPNPNPNPAPSSDSPWNSFLRRILLLRPSASPIPYAPIQLPNDRPPAKVSVQFGDPNIPRSPPVTESSSIAPKRPTPVRNITPTIAPPSHTLPNPNQSFAIPAVTQSVIRIAPLPDDSTPRARPVRAPTAPINLPTREPPLLRPPIEVVNISRPSNFTIDDTPSPAVTGLSVDKRRDYQRRPPNGTLHGQSRSDGYIVTHRQEPVESATFPARRSSLSRTRSQDSDSVIDQRFPRPRDEPTSHPASFQTPISEASSVSTTASIAGSSRPPTMTIRNLLNPLEAFLPSLHLPGPLSLSFPSSGQRTPNQAPSQASTPPRPRQHAAQSQSPPHRHIQFGESQKNHQPSYTPHYPVDRIRRHPSELQLGDHRGGTRLINEQEQGGLFPHAVIGAGYQTRRVPNPLPPVAAESRRLATPVPPPPTPNPWAPLRTNRL